MAKILIPLLLASTASAAWAAPQTPSNETGLNLLANQPASKVVGAAQGFVWSPDYGFSPAALPGAQDGAVPVGVTGSDLPGTGVKWHPSFGLVPHDFQPSDDGTASPVAWVEEGKSARVVYWDANDLQALTETVAPPSGVTLASVNQITKSGLILGQATVEGSDVPVLFLWSADSGLQILELPDGMTLTQVTSLSDDGKVTGTVTSADGTPFAVVLSSDGTLTPHYGPDGASARINGMTDSGMLVGETVDAPKRALIWNADGSVVPLGGQLSQPLPDGLTLLTADDINARGEIVARAQDPNGAVHLVTLRPDAETPEKYVPRVIGEIDNQFSGNGAPRRKLLLGDNGAIIGECSFGASDCPSTDISFDFITSDITNVGDIPVTGSGFQPLVTGRSLSASGPGAGAAGGGAGAGGTGSGGGNGNPGGAVDFGNPGFPSISSGSTDDDDTGTVDDSQAVVPLPAAGVLMVLALTLLSGVGAGLSSMRSRLFGRA